MLLQTNSYVVPKEKRAEHARLLRKFRQTLMRLGCESFEVYEQVGANWSTGETTGRFVQIMRFRDRKHQLAVQTAERNDSTAQALIAEFCELTNFPYQQQQGLFAVGFYNSVLPIASARHRPPEVAEPPDQAGDVAPEVSVEQAAASEGASEEQDQPEDQFVDDTEGEEPADEAPVEDDEPREASAEPTNGESADEPLPPRPINEPEERDLPPQPDHASRR